jgi:hypothetical protein
MVDSYYTTHATTPRQPTPSPTPHGHTATKRAREEKEHGGGESLEFDPFMLSAPCGESLGWKKNMKGRERIEITYPALGLLAPK